MRSIYGTFEFTITIFLPGPFEIVVVVAVVDNDGCYLNQKSYGLVHKT